MILNYVGYYQGTYDTAGTAPTVYSSEITSTPSVHYFDFIATGTTVTILLIANNNGVVYFDDVSFRKTDGNQSEDLFILMNAMIIYLLVLQEILIFFTMVLLIGLQNSGQKFPITMDNLFLAPEQVVLK